MDQSNQINGQKSYRPPDGLIITPSGMRGKIGQTLTLDPVIRFTKSYGKWLGLGKKIILGRDTRSTSKMISDAVSASLVSSGVHVYNVKTCPTPAILYYIRIHNFDGAVIITGSHNPPEYNGIKYLSDTFTFLGHQELNEVNQYFLSNKPLSDNQWSEIGTYKNISIIDEYVASIEEYLDVNLISEKKLRVVVDPGAGAGAGVTDQILKNIGCEVTTINSEFLDYPNFPRKIEPVMANLTELSNKVVEGGADIGFAHDCDADRVAIVGKDGKIYPEDTTVALLIKYVLETEFNKANNAENCPIIVTNSASSLIVEEIAKDFNAEVIRTPVGERHLAMKMYNLIEKYPDRLIFGGEGSSGGFMYPKFNNARDGIFAAAKMCEVLSYYKRSLEELLEELPRFYSIRNNLRFENSNVSKIIQDLKSDLTDEGISYIEIERDIKVIDMDKMEWTLLHPSNTEPVLRVITEAKSKIQARNLCVSMSKRVLDKK